MTQQHQGRRRLPYTDFTECWMVPGETHIIDLVHPDDGLTLHDHGDAETVRSRYPGAVRMNCDEAWNLIDTAALVRYRKDVTEVSEQRFMDALNVLPPVGWTSTHGVESFKLSECLWGNITDIFARLGDCYFVLSDDIRLPAAIVAARVSAFAAAHPADIAVHQQEADPRRPADPARAPVLPLVTPKPGSSS
jgi:hypothetical protein